MWANGWHAINDWLDRHYLAALVLTTSAFLLQLFHLYWLFSDVIVERLTGEKWFSLPPRFDIAYVVADFVEIPALVSTTILYVSRLRRDRQLKSIIFVVLLNTQWLHLFWITDNVVMQAFAEEGVFAWDAWVAWVAILIDYLEVPVIIEMLRKVAAERGVIAHRLKVRLVGA